MVFGKEDFVNLDLVAAMVVASSALKVGRSRSANKGCKTTDTVHAYTLINTITAAGNIAVVAVAYKVATNKHRIILAAQLALQLHSILLVKFTQSFKLAGRRFVSVIEVDLSQKKWFLSLLLCRT